MFKIVSKCRPFSVAQGGRGDEVFFLFSVTFYSSPSYYTQNNLIAVTNCQHLYDGERI